MGFFRAITAVDTGRPSVQNKDMKDCRRTSIFLSIVFSRAKESYDRLRNTVLYDDLIHVLQDSLLRYYLHLFIPSDTK